MASKAGEGATGALLRGTVVEDQPFEMHSPILKKNAVTKLFEEPRIGVVDGGYERKQAGRLMVRPIQATTHEARLAVGFVVALSHVRQTWRSRLRSFHRGLTHPFEARTQFRDDCVEALIPVCRQCDRAGRVVTRQPAIDPSCCVLDSLPDAFGIWLR